MCLLPEVPRRKSTEYMWLGGAPTRQVSEGRGHQICGHLKDEFNAPMMPREISRPQSAETLIDLRDLLVKGTDQLARIGESILAQESWDLFFVGFGATHRGGHLLWDLSQIDQGGLSPETIRALRQSLEDVYRSCDGAVARLIEKAPQDAKILVFSIHGMGPEAGWISRFPQILSLIQGKTSDTALKKGFLYKMRNRMPWQLVREFSGRVPQGVLNWLVSVWSANMFDWKTTRYFPVLPDFASHVRINLKDREPKGIVEPGDEYDALCEELTGALLSFRDIETDQPIVAQVYRADDFAGRDAPYRDRLPDLVIRWGDMPAIESRGIRSDEYGEIQWNSKEKHQSGRSGNHRQKGWFVAVGDGIRAGTRAKEHRTVDLVPTIFEWLGVERRKDFQGDPIPEIS